MTTIAEENGGRESRQKRVARRHGLSLIYMDNHLLVVGKPAGVLIQQDVSGDLDLLRQAKVFLKELYQKPGAVFLGLVHRLDRNVSGVIVFARTSKAASRLSEQIRMRSVEKTYLALLCGRPDDVRSWRDHVRKRNQTAEVVSPNAVGAKLASLRIRELAFHEGLCLVEIGLETGRFHQIRVQCAHRAVPILGDYRYGATKGIYNQALGLHCHSMRVMHPVGGRVCHFGADLPSYWPQWARPAIEKLSPRNE